MEFKGSTMSKACLNIRPQGFGGGDVSNADFSYTEKTSDVSECWEYVWIFIPRNVNILDLYIKKHLLAIEMTQFIIWCLTHGVLKIWTKQSKTKQNNTKKLTGVTGAYWLP